MNLTEGNFKEKIRCLPKKSRFGGEGAEEKSVGGNSAGFKAQRSKRIEKKGPFSKKGIQTCNRSYCDSRVERDSKSGRGFPQEIRTPETPPREVGQVLGNGIERADGFAHRLLGKTSNRYRTEDPFCFWRVSKVSGGKTVFSQKKKSSR